MNEVRNVVMNYVDKVPNKETDFLVKTLIDRSVTTNKDLESDVTKNDKDCRGKLDFFFLSLKFYE